jgi:hypothetical protein
VYACAFSTCTPHIHYRYARPKRKIMPFFGIYHRYHARMRIISSMHRAYAPMANPAGFWFRKHFTTRHIDWVFRFILLSIIEKPIISNK